MFAIRRLRALLAADISPAFWASILTNAEVLFANGQVTDALLHILVGGWGMCREQSPVPASVYDQAWQEAYRYKWIESERQGRDLGHAAIKDWSCRHFKRFYRWRHWLHLTGRQWFHEFPEKHFNTVQEPRDEIARLVIDRFWDGQENLGILVSAHGCGWPIEKVRAVLASLGINEARLNPLVK